jgi:hypothetical protein
VNIMSRISSLTKLVQAGSLIKQCGRQKLKIMGE